MRKKLADPRPGGVGPTYGLVIFDMDGTLTEELLDFGAIRGEIGVPSEEVGILEHISSLAGEARARAEGILHGHEIAAAERCALHAGAEEVLAGLKEAGVKTALLTRNSGACAERVLGRHGLELDYVASRENRPHKPHPDSILNIVRAVGVSAEETLMVGDYVYDLQAAAGAGVDSALLVNGKRELPEFAPMATYRISGLRELLGIVLGGS
ncbi:MAG: HAD family hydrolase [Phycisphaerae bacterium]